MVNIIDDNYLIENLTYNLFVPPNKVQPIVKNECLPNSTIILSCKTSKPLKKTAKISWLFNGSTLKSSDKYVMSQEGTEITLKINKFSFDADNGLYSVQIVDAKLELNDQIQLGLADSSNHLGPLIIQGDDIHEGGKVILVAKVDKKPQSIEWFKDGKKITPKDDRFAPTIDDNLNIKLAIDNLQLTDSCIYDLKVDEAKSSYKLIVNELPVAIVEDLAFEIFKSETDKEILKLWCMTNKSLNLLDQKYNVCWFKDDKLIKTAKSAKYQFENEDENKIHILLVDAFSKDLDCGLYEIKIFLKDKKQDTLLASSQTEVNVAQDDEEEEEEPVSEDVLSEPETQPEEIVPDLAESLTPSSLKPSSGENLNILAKLTQPIDPEKYKLQWFLNSLPVELSKKFPRYNFVPKSDQEHTFAIKPLNIDEEGALIELALIKLDGNQELKRVELQLEKPLKVLKELQTAKPVYNEDSEGEMSCELNKKPLSLKLFKNDKQPTEVLCLALNKDRDDEKLDDEKFLLSITKSKIGGHKLSVTVKGLNPDQDKANYWLEFNDNELVTNLCFLNVKPTDLKFNGNLTTPNGSPLENVENIEIEFTLNKHVPIEKLSADIQVKIKKGTKRDAQDSASFTISLSEKPKTTKSECWYRLILKKPASTNDSGEYSLHILSSDEDSPNSLPIEVISSHLFALELPERVELFEQEPLKLQVKSNQAIKAYFWLKDSAKISDKDKLKTEKLTYIFNLPSAKLSDGGVYEFVCDDFKDKAGSIKNATKCSVVVKPKPEKQLKSLTDLGVVKLKEDDSLLLPVKFDKPLNKADIKLYLNGNEFIPSEHGEEASIKYNPDTSAYSVQINRVKPGRDDGVYKIKTPNSESECRVEIEEKPVKFVSELENFRLKVLPEVFYKEMNDKNKEFLLTNYPQTAAYECQLSKACADVTWSVNDKPIDEKHKEFGRFERVVSKDGKTQTLIIKNCKLADNNSLIELKLNKTNKTSSASLKVEQVPLDYLIKLRNPLADLRVKEEEAASFECEVQINPLLAQLGLPIGVLWLKSNEEIKTSSDKYKLKEEIDKSFIKASLEIKNCTGVDVADYECKFYINSENQCANLVDSRAKLSVRESDVRLVKELPSTLTINSGDSIELECVLSKANLNVEWFRDNQSIKDKAKISTKSEPQNTYCLKLENCTPKDSGKYKLELKNISTECKLIVKEPRIAVKQPLNKVNVKETENANFETEFSQNIANNQNVRIEWYKNGKRLYFSNKSPKYQMSLEGAKCKLVILDCNVEDEGEYELKLYTENDDAPVAQKAQLKVIPLDVTIVEQLSDVTVNEGDTAKLNFKASKSCMCEWYKLKGADLKKALEELKKNPLIINDASLFEKLNPDDRVVFSFRADNTYGLGLHDVQVSEF